MITITTKVTMIGREPFPHHFEDTGEWVNFDPSEPPFAFQLQPVKKETQTEVDDIVGSKDDFEKEPGEYEGEANRSQVHAGRSERGSTRPRYSGMW
jgi:hypothetical protein